MSIIEIDEKRWAEVRERGLKHGAHRDPEHGMCAMEAVAYIRRQPHSDTPPCVSSVIGAFMRSWNDGLPDDERHILLPLLPKLVDTVNPALENRRALMCADWLVRVHTPAWLRLAGLTQQADTLASLPEITSMAQVPSICGPLEAVRKDASAAGDAARDAAWDAARDAARAAARDAARDGARVAAWDGARVAAWDAAWDGARVAAWDAARDAAWAAARDAARDAAWDGARDAAGDAARAKLEPTRKQLQASAIELVERMCVLTEEDLAA